MSSYINNEKLDEYASKIQYLNDFDNIRTMLEEVYKMGVYSQDLEKQIEIKFKNYNQEIKVDLGIFSTDGGVVTNQIIKCYPADEEINVTFDTWEHQEYTVKKGEEEYDNFMEYILQKFIDNKLYEEV